MNLRDLEPTDREMELLEQRFPTPSLLLDLAKDKKKFFEYTLKWAMSIELLIENHLSELIALEQYLKDPQEFRRQWEKTKFCKGCVVAHSLELMGYSSECITGACPFQPAWKELQNTADEMYNFFKPLKKIEQFTREVFERAKEFRTKLRNIRKALTEDNTEPNIQEYIT